MEQEKRRITRRQAMEGMGAFLGLAAWKPHIPFCSMPKPEEVPAEGASLGPMILDNQTVLVVTRVLGTGECFKIPAHRMIYSVILELHRAHLSFDIPALRDVLNARGQLHDVGGEPYLINLADSTPSPKNALLYALAVANRPTHGEDGIDSEKDIHGNCGGRLHISKGPAKASVESMRKVIVLECDICHSRILRARTRWTRFRIADEILSLHS